MSSESPDSRRLPFDPRHAVVAVTLIGAALRAAVIDYQSFWYDECASALLARAPVRDMVMGVARDLGNPPLHSILLRLWSLVFGTSDAALRSLSAVAGVASIPVLYSVAKRLTSQVTALIAATILALSPVHVYFGQEARAYTLVALLCLVSLDMLLRGVEQPRRAWVWVIHSLTVFLAIYTHYFAFFVVLAQFLWVLFEHRKARPLLGRFLASLGGAALLYLTWLPVFFAQATTKGNLARAAETWHLHVLSSPLVFGVGTTLIWKDTISPTRVVLAGVAALAFGVPAIVGVWALRRNRASVTLLSAWLLFPVLLPLLISALLFPFYYVRYGLLASPAYYVLIAAGLVHLSRSARAACVVGMTVTAATSLFFYYTTRVKHDWRNVAAYIDENVRPDDIVTFDADIGETTYSRYGSRAHDRIRLVPPIPQVRQTHFYGTTPDLGIPFDVTGQLLESGRVWFVFSDPKVGSGKHYKTLFENGWRLVSEKGFQGVDVRIYELTSSYGK